LCSALHVATTDLEIEMTLIKKMKQLLHLFLFELWWPT